MSRPDPFRGFDPNALNSDQPKWATYIPGRSGVGFKLHRQRGHAVNAVVQHSNAILYEFEDGRWVERCRRVHDPEQHHCDICGTDTHQDLGGRRPYNQGRFAFVKGKDRKADISQLKFMCSGCRRSWA